MSHLSTPESSNSDSLVIISKSRRRFLRTPSPQMVFWLLVAASPFLGFLYWRDMDPPVPPPAAALPSPNAFDYDLQAASMIRDRDALFSIEYQDYHFNPSEHYYSLPEQKAIVAENAPALQRMREGFAFTGRDYPIPQVRGQESSWLKLRRLTRLLSVEANLKGIEGNWGYAANDGLDQIRLGVDCSSGNGVEGAMFGMSFQTWGQTTILKAIPNLDARHAKAALQRLDHILQSRVSCSDMLRNEEAQGQSDARQIFHAPFWRFGLARFWQQTVDFDQAFLGMFGTKTPKENVLWAKWTQLQLLSRRQIDDRFTGYMEKLISIADQPYSRRQVLPHAPTDPVNEVLCIMMDQQLFDDTTCSTRYALLRSALALHAYRCEHRRYPKDLQALVPGYLQAVPADPFGGSQPLRYLPDGLGYRLYSVGPDGEDNGGVHYVTNVNGRTSTTWLQPESWGDIVLTPDSQTF